MPPTPFWPRRSPNFAALRAAVRPYLAGLSPADAPGLDGLRAGASGLDGLRAGASGPGLFRASSSSAGASLFRASSAGAGACAVGLSGGPDSLALAAALAAEGADCVALCVDHGLQEDSHEVAQRSARQAREFGLEAKVLPVDAGVGEAAARRARYRAMAAVGLPVFIAHTAQDQAETLLLSALRGKVTGMAAYAQVEGCQVIRPLLELPRAVTVGACAELELEPWQDPHNLSTDFRRVRIRHEVLPLLEDIVSSNGTRGDAVAPLAQAAADIAADEAFLCTPASADCAELAALPAPRRRRAIRAWLRLHEVEISRASLGMVESLVTNWHGQGPVAVKNQGARLEVARQDGKLTLLPGIHKEH